jgi:hypothetical protein
MAETKKPPRGWWDDFRWFMITFWSFALALIAFSGASIYLAVAHQPILSLLWIAFWISLVGGVLYANSKDKERGKRNW